jgi:hypothetical protein
VVGQSRLSDIATPALISDYCRQYYELCTFRLERKFDRRGIPSGSEAFFQALSASDSICAIVRDWPTYSIIRSSPMIIGALSAPASIQLLVKQFSDRTGTLAEKASFALRNLTLVMEQAAEYWELSALILGT